MPTYFELFQTILTMGPTTHLAQSRSACTEPHPPNFCQLFCPYLNLHYQQFRGK